MWECRTRARSPALSRRLMPAARSCRGRPAAPGEAGGPVQVPGAQAEVRGGDRRREAVVERLGQAKAFVDAVPAEPDRQLVCAQLAGMEETEQLDLWEVALAELAELLGAVLVDVPGVVGLLRPG